MNEIEVEEERECEEREYFDRRVEFAASVLDEIEPGWALLVDCDSLNLMNTSWCIAGQVFRNKSLENENLARNLGEPRYCNGYSWMVQQDWYKDRLEAKYDDVFASDVDYREVWITAVKDRLDEGIEV